MGILLNFFKEVNDEANRNIAKENADRICLEVFEYMKNGEYPPEELFVRSKKAEAPYSLFDEDATNAIAYKVLRLAEYRGLNTRNNTDSMNTLLSEIVKVHDEILEFGLANLDLENAKEYLSNKEFLVKYNFTDDIYEYIDTLRDSLKEEMYNMAAICSYIETIVHFSELFMEYYNNFGDEDKMREEIHRIPTLDTFEKAVTKKLKENFFYYKYKNIVYFNNDKELIEKGLSTYHPNSEIENPYTLYKTADYVSNNTYFSPYSYKQLEKEFELFYINEDIATFREFSQDLKTILNKKISAHWYAIESLKEKVTQFKVLKQGEDGENYAYNYLEEHLPDNWIILQNINTPYKDSQRENDIIVINEKGVFTIEVKNYIGGSLEIKNDGKVIHKRGKEVVDDKQDIIEQSENHVTAVADFLEKNYPLEGINWINYVKGIVVISNDEMTINNESSYPIFRTSLVRPYILNMPNNVLNKEQIEDIKNIMLKTSKDDLKFPYMATIEGLYNENFTKAIKNISNKFFNDYVKFLDGIDKPMNLAQSLACFPKRGSYGGYEIISNEKNDLSLHRKLKNIFDEENADHVAKLWFNNFRIK